MKVFRCFGRFKQIFIVLWKLRFLVHVSNELQGNVSNEVQRPIQDSVKHLYWKFLQKQLKVIGTEQRAVSYFRKAFHYRCLKYACKVEFQRIFSLQKQPLAEVLQNRKFTGKHLCWTFFSIRLLALFTEHLRTIASVTEEQRYFCTSMKRLGCMLFTEYVFFTRASFRVMLYKYFIFGMLSVEFSIYQTFLVLIFKVLHSAFYQLQRTNLIAKTNLS